MASPLRGIGDEVEERRRIFRALIPYFGTIQRSALFQRTSEAISSVRRVHNFIEGIYKPERGTYALAIASMLKSPYSDEVFYNADRTWWMNYSAKAAPMHHAVNASVLRCMTDREPLLVLRQVSDKSSRDGARHRLLGLGRVEHFDGERNLFRVRGLEWGEVAALLGIDVENDADDVIQAALRVQSLEQWMPFIPEDRSVYRVSRQKRDAAFRTVVLANYDHTCAVTGQRFHSPRHVEADGAHIIGKDVCGTDDPRNGVALSKSVHWAFDRGIFTISDQYEVVVNPKVASVSISKFPIVELDRTQILLPADANYRPHPDALAWHKQEVFDRFAP